jgi:hypothetical protein
MAVYGSEDMYLQVWLTGVGYIQTQLFVDTLQLSADILSNDRSITFSWELPSPSPNQKLLSSDG